MAEKSWHLRSVRSYPTQGVASNIRYNQGVFIWDETKRQANLVKHTLDFVDAPLVYNNPGKLTQTLIRKGEERHVDTAIVEVNGTCLTLVYTYRGVDIRVISFRPSSRRERHLLICSRQPNELGVHPLDAGE